MIELAELTRILLFGGLSGGAYALLALGFTLIYGVSGVVNLAHGTFYMLGTYIFSVLGTTYFPDANPILVLVLAVVFVGFVGSILYRLTIHPILGDEVGVMVATICLALIFQQLILLMFGTPPLTVAPFVSGFITVLGETVRNVQILILGISLLIFVSLWMFISKTRTGKAMRAVSQDREVAMLMGINTERLYMLTMALSAIIAATAGIFIQSSTSQSTVAFIWLQPLALSFSIVILGGMGSIKGSLIGGFLIGYAEKAVHILAPQSGTILPAIPFTVMVLVLLLRPKGLFGKRVEMED